MRQAIAWHRAKRRLIVQIEEGTSGLDRVVNAGMTGTSPARII
jgi:hypothetical protein